MSFSNLVTAQVVTTSGNSGDGCTGPISGNTPILLNVTAVSGTLPTMDLAMEWSADGVTWFPGQPADTFTQVTAVVKVCKAFVTKGPHFRIVWTIGGTTPSFTFTVQAVTYPANRVPSI